MISVIVPSLNSAGFLAEALESALSQRVDLEIVVQDGGSVDDTERIISRFDDERVRFVREQDAGQADAVNRAIANARGEWVVWLNADDVLVDGALCAVAHALSDDVDVVYGDALLVNRAGRVLRTYRAPHCVSRGYVLRHGMVIFSGSMLLRRDWLLQQGGLDPALAFCMDYEFLARIVQSARMRYVPVPIGAFRVHSASKSGTKPWSFFREHRHVRRRFPEVSTAPVANLVHDARLATYIVTSPLRYSRAWSLVRKVKQR